MSPYPREVAAVLKDVVQALSNAGIPYAVGGAISYGYHTIPRGTTDIDIDVFLLPESGAEVLQALVAADVRTSHVPDPVQEIATTGQIRTLVRETYVDLFFSHHEYFSKCAERAITVPFEDIEIRVLQVEDITNFKVMFNRGRDWVDIEQMLYSTADRFEIDYCATWLSQMLGADDSRIRRLRDLYETARAEMSDAG